MDLVHFARNVSCGFGRVWLKMLGCDLKEWIERGMKILKCHQGGKITSRCKASL